MNGLRARECSFPGCHDRHLARGYCARHYWQADVQKSFGRICSFGGCGRGLKAKGLCAGHYHQQYAGKLLSPISTRREPVCVVVIDGVRCDRPYNGLGFCTLHYQRFKKHGDPLGGGRRMAPPLDGICLEPGCREVATAKGLCVSHYGSKRNRMPEVRDRHRQKELERNFSLTVDAYSALLAFQGRCCAVCGSTDPPNNGTEWSWHVDHDRGHCPGPRSRSCGDCVRGLLCHFCNTRVVPVAERMGDGCARVMTYLANPPYQSLLARGRQ